MTSDAERGRESLERYVSAIEDHLRARRGVEHILSPRDFALARAWHAAGLPLATVLVGMDRAFEHSPNVSSLAFCRRRVEELAASGARPQLRPGPPAESVPLSEVQSLLSSLLDNLQRVRPPLDGSFEPPLAKIQEVLDLLAVATRPNWEYVRGKLREIDDDVSAAVLGAFTSDQLEEFRAEAARAIERHRGRVDDAALDDARTRFTLQRAREKLGLPRVSLV